MTRDWDAYWQQAAWLAASMSTCRSRQVGAVIVRDRRSLATGFNGNVPGGKHCVDGGCPRCWQAGSQVPSGTGLDECVCVHAEANAVANCARYGVATMGTEIYCTTKPCLECVKLLAVAGVGLVVFDVDYPAEYDAPPTMTFRRFRE